MKLSKVFPNSLQGCLTLLKGESTQKCLILTYDWFGLDYKDIFSKAIDNNIVFVKYEISNNHTRSNVKFDEADYMRTEYKGVRLYQASLYTICNELEVMPRHIDPSNKNHMEVIKHWYQETVRHIDYAISLFDETVFSKVIIPQGYVLEAAVIRQIAISRNIKVIAIENSLNKNRLLWDDVCGTAVNSNLSRNYYWKFENIIDETKAADYSYQFLESIKQVKSDEHSSPKTLYRKNTNRKTVLFLGQVYLDSSLIFGLYDFVDTVDLLEVLCRYCEQMGYLLIVKLHPKEIGGNDIVGKPFQQMTWRKIMANNYLTSRVKDENLLFIDYQNSYDTYSLIRTADVCITVNSMSGLEALLFGKDVIICGKCSYGGLGFTFDSFNKEMLPMFLDMVLQKGVSFAKKDEIRNFFYIYMEKYCIDKSARSFLDLIKNR